jgi:hypothetical protein
MTDLIQAIAELRRDGPEDATWTASLVADGNPYQSSLAGAVATTLNAALSGDLIPKADADLAVALMVEKAADVVEAQGHWMQNQNLIGNGFDLIQQGKVIRALVPASALAELQALRDARTALTGDRATDFDNDAVYQFSKLMKDKMAKSRAKGRKGWNDPTQCSPDFLRHLLYEHIYKGDPVDVANLCMMLRHYDEPTTPKPEDDLRLLHTEADLAELATLRAQVERLTGALGDMVGLFSADNVLRKGTHMNATLKLARAALAQTPTDPGDGWTWNERLGLIGPDGKPADPRRRG